MLTGLEPRVLLGNAISVLASIFLLFGCIARTKKYTYFFQVFECIFLAISQVAFGMYPGAASALVSGGRNLLVSKERFGKREMILFSVLCVVLGIVGNIGGLLRLSEDLTVLLAFLPVMATLQFTICSYFAKTVLAAKYALLFNTGVWVVYSVLIYDFATALTNGILFVSLIVVIVRFHIENAQAAKTIILNEGGESL